MIKKGHWDERFLVVGPILLEFQNYCPIFSKPNASYGTCTAFKAFTSLKISHWDYPFAFPLWDIMPWFHSYFQFYILGELY